MRYCRSGLERDAFLGLEFIYPRGDYSKWFGVWKRKSATCKWFLSSRLFTYIYILLSLWSEWSIARSEGLIWWPKMCLFSQEYYLGKEISYSQQEDQKRKGWVQIAFQLYYQLGERVFGGNLYTPPQQRRRNVSQAWLSHSLSQLRVRDYQKELHNRTLWVGLWEMGGGEFSSPVFVSAHNKACFSKDHCLAIVHNTQKPPP